MTGIVAGIRCFALPPPPDCLAEYELHLSVDAAQFVRGPGLEFGPEPRINAQEECLAFFGGHGTRFSGA